MLEELNNNEVEKFPLSVVEITLIILATLMFFGGMLMIFDPLGIYREMHAKTTVGLTEIAFASGMFYGVIILSIRSLKKIDRPVVNGKIEPTIVDAVLGLGVLISFVSFLGLPILYLNPEGMLDTVYSHNIRMAVISITATLAFASTLTTLIIAIWSVKK